MGRCFWVIQVIHSNHKGPYKRGGGLRVKGTRG